MIIVKIWGGLGNQMFQYAAAKSLAIKNNTQLKLDVSSYKNQSVFETPRKFGLNVFKNITDDIASDRELNSIASIFNSDLKNKIYRNINKRYRIINKNHIIQNGFTFSSIQTNGQSDLYLDGYWQSEKYFNENKDVIKKCFNLDYLTSIDKLQSYLNEMNLCNSVSIHVRRSDYVTNTNANNFHGVCTIGYYNEAIRIFSLKKLDNLVFYVFSDDIEWCENNLNIPCQHKYVVTDHDYEDLYLMLNCKHNIIANSSFSWWAAWLNNNLSRIIIAPSQWFNDPNIAINILPDSWTKIAR